LEKCGTLRKGVILGKGRHSCENVAHFKKCATLGKMRRNWKSTRYLEKCDIWKNTSHLGICGTLEKVLHNWENAAYLKNVRHTLTNAAHLKKCGTLGKGCQFCYLKNGHLSSIYLPGFATR